METIIEVELPNGSGFSGSPSGDSEYEDACDAAINAALPEGAKILKRATRRVRIVQDFAVLTVQLPDPGSCVSQFHPIERIGSGVDCFYNRCTHCGGSLDATEFHSIGQC